MRFVPAKKILTPNPPVSLQKPNPKANMSRINKQKHVRMNEMGDGDFDPPGVNQQFARVVRSRGNNLHEVEPAEPIVVTPSADDEDAQPTAAAADGAEPQLTFLASMPPKFRKNIWIKRGNFVIVEMIAEGNKVKAEIARILLPEHVREFKKDGIWPTKFDVQRQTDEETDRAADAVRTRRDSGDSSADDDASDDDDDADLVRNTNGWHAVDSDESEDSDESSSEEEDEANDEKVEKVSDKQQ